MYIGLHVQYQLLSSDFYETLIFSIYFRKIFIYQISWKSIHDEANSRFSQLRENP